LGEVEELEEVDDVEEEERAAGLGNLPLFAAWVRGGKASGLKP